MNVYGEPLTRCVSDDSGSSRKGRCVADDIHRVCVKRLGSYDRPSGGRRGFSSITGQGPWSRSRGDASHCVCSGAYANYVSRTDDRTGKRCRSALTAQRLRTMPCTGMSIRGTMSQCLTKAASPRRPCTVNAAGRYPGVTGGARGGCRQP